MDRKRCWKREGPLFESVEGMGPKQIVMDVKSTEEIKNGLAATHHANMAKEIESGVVSGGRMRVLLQILSS